MGNLEIVKIAHCNDLKLVWNSKPVFFIREAGSPPQLRALNTLMTDIFVCKLTMINTID